VYQARPTPSYRSANIRASEGPANSRRSGSHPPISRLERTHLGARLRRISQRPARPGYRMAQLLDAATVHQLDRSLRSRVFRLACAPQQAHDHYV